MFAASTVATVSRITLGIALLAAGMAKVAQGREWNRQAAATGTPAVVASGVPWLELAIGAAVAAGVWSPWPTVAGIGLVLAFTVWIVVQLSAGRHPPCACFGAFSGAPLSWWHAARNCVLVGLGLVAVLA